MQHSALERPKNTGDAGRVAAFPHDLFAYAGLPAVANRSEGRPYRVWSGGHGSCFVLPDLGDRTSAETLRRFGRTFPELERPTRFLWRMGAHDRVLLDGAAVESLSKALDGETGIDSLPGFRVAVPGAYRKITAAVPGPALLPRAFGKLAAHEGGEARILAESEVLSRLETVPELRGRVPRLEGSRQWRGRRLLVLSPGPIESGPRRFDALPRDFLALLHAGTSETRSFRGSGAESRWRHSVESLDTKDRSGHASVLRDAAARLEQDLETEEFPLSLAHGDFTPWNTRRGPDGLFAFDWETGFIDALPGHDAFHFVSLPRMLRGRELQLPPSIVAWIVGLWPPAERLAGHLWLSYLVETGLQYALARASRPQEGDDRVLSAVVSAIARRIGGR